MYKRQVRKLTAPIDKKAVRKIACEKGMGRHTLSVLADYVDDPKNDVRFVKHLKEGKSHEEFDPDIQAWVDE